MELYKVFVSTCEDVKTMYKTKARCDALELPYKWSPLFETKADSLDDAFKALSESDIYKDFVNQNYGDVHFYYLVNGEPTFYK